MKKIIIIGSGIGGLVAGNLLVKRGHQVTIFEAHSSIGGYTAGFRKKGFYFESGTLSFEASAMVFRAMRQIGVLDKIGFVRQKVRFLSDDFDAVPETYDEFKKVFFNAYLSEVKQLHRYFSTLDPLVRAMESVIAEKPWILKIPAFLNVMMVCGKYADLPLSKFVERYFPRDSKLYRILCDMGYPDMAAWIVGGMFVTFLSDYWTVRDGMQSWADTLGDQFKKLGGVIMLNARVSRITTQNGVADGVCLGDKKYTADEVIAACDYKETFLELLDTSGTVPPDENQKIKNSAVSEAVFTVYLGLKWNCEELLKLMKVPHLWFFDGSLRTGGDGSYGDAFFEKASMTLYSPSLINPSLAPSGKSSLMIQTFVPQDWMDHWGGGERARYRELKARVHKILVEKAAKLLPGLAGAIEFQDAATPLTYERFTRNTAGATSSWSWNPQKRFYPDMKIHTKTPIKHLYIGSCWASQLGGIPGAISAAIACAKVIH